jgi:antitoxin (DNA-binding transcriptional repressor) of toxin-antitoxin stability system
MIKSIPQRILRNENSKIINEVISGETFVVTRNGKPVAELRPLKLKKLIFIDKFNLKEIVRTIPHIDSQRYRNDIDKFISQSL